MKKTIFSIITALLLYALTLLVFHLPDDVIYKVKQPASEMKLWANIWGIISIIILCACTFHYYVKLGEKLFDYLKKD